MATYRDVKDAKGVNGTIVRFISADGSTVAGSYNNSAGDDDGFIFNIATGLYTDVRDPNGLNSTSINGISADGGLVAGAYTNNSGLAVGFVENVATGTYTDVVDPNALYNTVVAAISGDGSTVAGYYDDAVGTKGFVENLTSGVYTDVNDPNPNTGTFINSISADGGVVAGYYQGGSGPAGFVENVATGVYTDVKDPKGTGNSLVQGLSADGAKAVGYYFDSSRGYVSFVENIAAGTYTDIYDPKATGGTIVEAISADGTTVVGNHYNNDGEFGFVENLATGVYADVDDPNGVQGTLAYAVSGDGALVGGVYGDAADDSVGYIASDLACYGRGSSILTVDGPVAIEDLKIGDLVVTTSGQPRPIRWIGHRMVDCGRHPQPDIVWPIRISAGAFGPDLPQRDLWLSPGHNIAFEGALIEARRLLNGRSVVQVKRDHIEYWHVELETHDVIWAEGLPAETYLDTGNRTAFANGGAFVEAHPDFRPRHWAETCLPIVCEGAPLVRARTQLFERLPRLAVSTTTDSDLHLVANGGRIAPLRLGERRFAFVIPGTRQEARLISRSFVPAHHDAENADLRALGLCIGRLQIDGEDIALDDPAAFTTGWHAWESGHRWTDGDAALPARARLVVIDLANEGSYATQAPERDVRPTSRRA